MFSMKRLGLVMLPAVLMLLVAACGDDPTATPRPTATPTSAPEPTATPEPPPAPTATPTTAPEPEPAAEFDGTYVLRDVVVEDGKFELRMGPTAYWAYDAEQRIPTIPGLIEIVMGPIRVGEIISFARCRQSGRRSTKPHNFTIEGLGIDFEPVGREPYSITFDTAGTFVIDDSTDPGEHGTAKIIVEGEAVAAAGVTYEINTISIEDGKIELRMGAEAYWGYAADQRDINSNEGDGWVITVNVGDALNIEVLAVSGRRSTKPHSFTIEGLGIDFEPVGREPYSITFDTAGTFVIDDSTDPGEHGTAKIIVE